MEAYAGEYIKNYLHLKRFPRISLHCKLVPVQYWEYEYGLLSQVKKWIIKLKKTISSLLCSQAIFPGEKCAIGYTASA